MAAERTGSARRETPAVSHICLNVVAVPHIADLIGDTGTVADCVPVKVCFCIVGSTEPAPKRQGLSTVAGWKGVRRLADRPTVPIARVSTRQSSDCVARIQLTYAPKSREISGRRFLVFETTAEGVTAITNHAPNTAHVQCGARDGPRMCALLPTCGGCPDRQRG
jgi:hypothetical protein